MSLQPHRKQGAKVEGRDESLEMEASPHERFLSLATRILQVPVERVREAEQRFAEGRKTQKTKSKPGRLIKNPKNAT